MVTRVRLIVAAVVLVGVVDLARALAPGEAPIAKLEAMEDAGDAADIARARVSVTDAAGERACVLRGGRHSCGAKGWQYVGDKEMKIAGKRERCVWAHPIAGATTSIHYPSVVSSEGAPRAIAFGLADKVSRKGGPVDVDVTFGGETTRHVHPARRGWTRFSLGEGSGPLTLAISAEKTGQRHFCFRIE